MGCQSEVYVGNNLTFSITCHDPDTGVLTDADSAPAYRVYEDETATPILTSTMTKLDDANTTGFYTELIACTAGNGFEHGKSYTIYIEATVDSDTGGISYGFAAVTRIADDLLGRDVGDVESTVAVHSLASAVLKAVSKVEDDSGTLKTYRTDGTTLHMSQAIGTDASADPIDSLGVGT